MITTIKPGDRAATSFVTSGAASPKTIAGSAISASARGTSNRASRAMNSVVSSHAFEIDSFVTIFSQTLSVYAGRANGWQSARR